MCETLHRCLKKGAHDLHCMTFVISLNIRKTNIFSIYYISVTIYFNTDPNADSNFYIFSIVKYFKINILGVFQPNQKEACNILVVSVAILIQESTEEQVVTGNMVTFFVKADDLIDT